MTKIKMVLPIYQPNSIFNFEWLQRYIYRRMRRGIVLVIG